jgi:hypothetical protein
MTDDDEMRRKPKQLGDAQWRFILKVRGAVARDHVSFFKENNWRNISPTTGSFDSNLLNCNSKRTSTVDSFYVKPVASWLPHLLIKNFVPSCPRCKSKAYVNAMKSRWINCPTVLYCTSRNRYLDTHLYPCDKCKRSFAGYNKKSMQLEAAVYQSYFNFYLGHGYGVEEELYRSIVDQSATESTASIAKRLKTQAYNQYYADYQLYLSAVAIKKITRPKKKQKTLTEMFPKVRADMNLEKLVRKKVDHDSWVSRCKLSINEAKAKLDKDIRFDTMLGDKDDHNIHGRNNTLAGLGSTKLRRLMSAGVNSMQELLAAQIDDRNITNALLNNLIGGWQLKVLAYYQHYQDTVDRLEDELISIEAQRDVAATNLENYKASILPLPSPPTTTPRGIVNPYRRGNAPTVEEDTLPPLFSPFGDKHGYNGKVLSKHRIDCIVMTVFNVRKQFQEAKMKCLTAAILKMDFNYKLAHKVRVWTKQGQSFCPYKCIVTIQNEDGLTVFWKALKHSESLSEIADDLRHLRTRLNRNAFAASNPAATLPPDKELPESVKVVYVDNCCSVSATLKAIFPGVLIKLDVYFTG